MKSELHKIETYIQHRDAINPKISKAGVAWHLDHSLKVINAISDTLQKSNPSEYKYEFNLMRSLILLLGFIPRGKGKAPKPVTPPEEIKTEDIVAQLDKARSILAGLDNLDPKANFHHPIFKQLHKKQALRFMEIHTKHHLKIIEAIVTN